MRYCAKCREELVVGENALDHWKDKHPERKLRVGMVIAWGDDQVKGDEELKEKTKDTSRFP